MKQLSKVILAGFVLTLLFSFTGFAANCNDVENKVVRLHVLANSNSEIDQNIKLKVKDDVFKLASKLTANASSTEEAEKVLQANIKEIENTANKKLAELNSGYTAVAEVTNSFFNTRDYDTFSLPAGNYKSLRVTIGEGKGRNWWCAVYPGLCLSSSSDFGELTNEEKDILTNKEQYKVSFKVYEIYQELMDLFRDR